MRFTDSSQNAKETIHGKEKTQEFRGFRRIHIFHQ